MSAAQDRFETWRLKKREIFVRVLDAGHGPKGARDDQAETATTAFLLECDRASLYASGDLLATLREFYEDPALVKAPEKWRGFVEALREDGGKN